jgi:hypothetical protein
MTGRPSRIGHDLVIQRAIRALPSLPNVFTAKQLQRQLPDRSANQCRRLMQVLVARGYCAPATRSAVSVANAQPPETDSDRILALLTATPTITRYDAATLLGWHHQPAYRLLERMVDLGLLRRERVPVPHPPHVRIVYHPAGPTLRAPMAVPSGCRDPHCTCPLAESDYDIRNGRLVRVVCRRNELPSDLEALACSR